MVTIRPWLLIGKYRETLDNELLARAGVGALLHLAAEVEPPGVTASYLPIEDGEPFEEATLRLSIIALYCTAGGGNTAQSSAIVRSGENCQIVGNTAQLQDRRQYCTPRLPPT